MYEEDHLNGTRDVFKRKEAREKKEGKEKRKKTLSDNINKDKDFLFPFQNKSCSECSSVLNSRLRTISMTVRALSTMVENGTSERSGGRERSEQSGASE